MDAGIQQALQSTLSRWQFFAPCPGTNVTVIDSRHGTWNGASGFADIDTAQAMRPHAGCYVYSITKMVTAVRILQLAEQRALVLDDPIARYLPNLSHLPEITLRRLLNHTSGIPNYTDLPEYLPANRAQPSSPWSYGDVMERTCSGTLDFAPGEGWHYSNTGYMLLHRLIETVSACSYADSISQAIIKPLGLRQTHVATGIDTGTLTPGYCPYLNEAEVMEDIVRKYHPGWCLTGLMASTTEETAQLYEALFGGQLIHSASLKEMTAPVPCNLGVAHPLFANPSYGLGMMLDPQGKYGGSHGHGGDGPGFNALAMHLPDFHGRTLTMVIFCNATISGHPYKLTKNLLHALEQNS